jgi:hypothetical protein
MAGLTPEGFVAKTEAEILADIEAYQRAHIDPGLDTSEQTLIGRLNRVFASKFAELWNLGSELYDMLDPDKVGGAQQDALYALTNTRREKPTKSKVTATVNLNGGTSIGVGEAVASVLGNDEARFVNVEPMVNADDHALDVQVAFEAENTGPLFAALAGTLTVIETPITGWNSITNALDAELGKDTESDADFAVRRLVDLAAPGGCSLIGMRADLSRLVGVTAVQVLENDTDVTNGDGMPPHSVEAVVLGGDDNEIAATVRKDTAGGITTFGSTLVVVTDEDGVDHDVRFSRPTERNAYVAVEVEVGDDYAGDAALKAALVAHAVSLTDASFLDVGTNVYAGRVVCSAIKVAGVLNARVGLSFSSISDPDAGVTKLTIGKREIARLDSSRISVTVLP